MCASTSPTAAAMSRNPIRPARNACTATSFAALNAQGYVPPRSPASRASGSSRNVCSSGGPFRGKSVRELAEVTPEQALRHPTWQMGPKITIDSATLANKGLEVIEAHFLFGLPYDRIEVVVHPPSIVHGLARFRDGAAIACTTPSGWITTWICE